ncbi:hypothetical protein Sfulv_18170 [Streptomyces fulvorobeus]|uniref:Uncharacterized protein n=1 Tax=Streptomyces fulvorobeus TaxID=284028 RepID=A0A7J0C5N3_9ACTN|nr:hypothetical protein Sfulv_18170 [Streptomyces fulvorobeus]
MQGNFVKVDEGASSLVVAVTGELSAVKPDADGAGLDAAERGGRVHVYEERGAHESILSWP